jgi:hypothetical protein
MNKEMKMKTFRIGILGSGNMGRTLGLRWAEAGYEIFFGSQFEHELATVRQHATVPVSTGSLDEAAGYGDILLFTARGLMPSQLIDKTLAKGKILVDINNFPIPDGFNYPAVEDSLAERAQRDLPDARVVKAFNNLAMEAYELPADQLESLSVSAFIAGDNATAKDDVAQLARVLGLHPIDVGPLRQARLLESMGDLIRLLMGGKAGFGPMAHLSMHRLPAASATRLGGRQPSLLDS